MNSTFVLEGYFTWPRKLIYNVQFKTSEKQLVDGSFTCNVTIIGIFILEGFTTSHGKQFSSVHVTQFDKKTQLIVAALSNDHI